MSESPKNYSTLLLAIGILFLVGSAVAIIGMGSLPAQAKEKIINFIKMSKPASEPRKQDKSLLNTQDSVFLQEDSSVENSLKMISPGQEYDFKMKIDEGQKAQQDAIEDYAYPTVQPGVPGSKEWQNEFWEDK